MALKDAQMKAIQGYQHGAVASQESGAQKAVERAVFAHTEVGISPHMTGSTAMRIPIDEDSARAISEARTFKKKPRRPLPPEQQQSNEIAQRIVQGQIIEVQAVRGKVNADVAQALSLFLKA